MVALFGHRLAGLPGTHIGRVSHSTRRAGWHVSPVGQPWHYWWQAHYLDAIVDAGQRRLRECDFGGADRRARLADRLVRTIWARNLGRFRNAYFDDMAWVALALDRLERFHHDLGASPQVQRPPPLRLVRRGTQELTAQLRSGVGDDLGGGVWWNTTRDFKNVPATGPVALHLARTGDSAAASELVDWMYDRLFDTDTGLFIDGVRVEAGQEQFVRDVYAYNQGTVLGTLVTLADQRSIDRAAHLIGAVAGRLTAEVELRHPLVTHGGGDGGLFTGILVRYLALASASDDLNRETRDTAMTLVRDTADELWSGRSERSTDDGTPAVVFPADPSQPASTPDDHVTSVELSTQLQAWMTFEAAARLPPTQPQPQPQPPTQR